MPAPTKPAFANLSQNKNSQKYAMLLLILSCPPYEKILCESLNWYSNSTGICLTKSIVVNLISNCVNT